MGGSKSSEAPVGMPYVLQCLCKAGTVHMLARGGTAIGPFTCDGVCKPVSQPFVYQVHLETIFAAALHCSGDRLASTFCVQVYRQVKTDKCAKVTQQTQCLSFLEYKKNKIQQLSLLGYGNTTCFCLFFFAFSPPAFFYSKSCLDLYKIRSGEKCRTEKKNADEGTG